MNKLKHLIWLLLALTVTLPVNAQLSPARLVRPGFPTATGVVDMTALQTSMYAAARNAGVTARAQLAQEAAKAIQHKFSYAAVMQHLPKARYVDLYIEKTWWSGAGLVEGGNILKARYVAYDLKEREIVEEKNPRVF